ncbi:hypothetical protein GCM10020219_026520 [Nonomuraea dietziae]
MRRRTFLPGRRPACGGGFGAGVTTLALMKKWEYLTAPVLIHNTKMILDNFGADGWELVQIVQGPDGQGLVAYFKREKA